MISWPGRSAGQTSSPKLSLSELFLPAFLQRILSRFSSQKSSTPENSPQEISPLQTSTPESLRPILSSPLSPSPPACSSLEISPAEVPLPDSPRLFPSTPSPPHDSHPPAEDLSPPVPWKPRMDDPLIISKQFGAEIRLDGDKILKRGSRVNPAEEAALRIVKQYTTIPVPEVYDADYTGADGYPWGKIWMERLPGSPLSETWDDLEDATKERICKELWGFVEQLRKIPKPSEFENFYQCGADGSVSSDVLLSNLGFPVHLLDDEALRQRINERYMHFGGASYRENLLDYLPRSNVSVFAHCDLAPRNVMVDEAGTITGLIDWEFAGWYPDYWEYAKTQLQWSTKDFMEWMDRTRPQDWDITGIHKAARILF